MWVLYRRWYIGRSYSLTVPVSAFQSWGLIFTDCVEFILMFLPPKNKLLNQELVLSKENLALSKLRTSTNWSKN